MNDQQTEEKSLTYEVIEPSRVLTSGSANGIFLPGAEGEIGILFNHIPLLVRLGLGVIRIHSSEGNRIHAAVNGGYAQVKDNKVIILADSAILGIDIDLQGEKSRLEQLTQQKLQDEAVGKDVSELKEQIKVCKTHIKAAEGCRSDMKREPGMN